MIFRIIYGQITFFYVHFMELCFHRDEEATNSVHAMLSNFCVPNIGFSAAVLRYMFHVISIGLNKDRRNCNLVVI